MRLSIHSPLFYIPIHGADPFNYRERSDDASGGERIFCFELDESEREKFEPDITKFLRNLIFTGKAAVKTAKNTVDEEMEASEELLVLPRGDYLFAQKREILNRDDILAMAAEIQQEGLWQRLRIGKRLYLRYLFEDGCVATQIFMPYA